MWCGFTYGNVCTYQPTSASPSDTSSSVSMSPSLDPLAPVEGGPEGVVVVATVWDG